MNIEPRELREYLTESGKNPFRDWLLGLKDGETRARVRVRLNRLRLGNFGDAKALGDGVHELRLNFGPGYRVYFGQDGKIVIILLCGGDKRTQARDISTAKAYWLSYARRVQW